MIDVNQNATLFYSLEGGRSRVILITAVITQANATKPLDFSQSFLLQKLVLRCRYSRDLMFPRQTYMHFSKISLVFFNGNFYVYCRDFYLVISLSSPFWFAAVLEKEKKSMMEAISSFCGPQKEQFWMNYTPFKS